MNFPDSSLVPVKVERAIELAKNKLANITRQREEMREKEITELMEPRRVGWLFGKKVQRTREEAIQYLDDWYKRGEFPYLNIPKYLKIGSKDEQIANEILRAVKFVHGDTIYLTLDYLRGIS